MIWIAQFLVAAPAAADHDLAREKLPDHWKSNAELTDVFFLNSQLGWAVGAQGVILRTANGGKDWKEVSKANEFTSNSMPLDAKFRAMRRGTTTRSTGIAGETSGDQPIRCRFESVYFVDANHGWVAGGYDIPYVKRSRAVILKTDDGGNTWKPIEGLVIPRINRIRFSDPYHGWAIGETSNLFKTGIFHTTNGGHSWSNESTQPSTGWIDAAPTKNGFATINYDGRPGKFNDNRYEPSVLIGTETASLTQLQMADPQSGWAVGDQGTLLTTTNGGLSWSPPKNFDDPSSFLPIIKHFDLKTLAITDQKIWFAGDPGTYLFSIDRNSGKTTANPTPLQTRINQVHFVDDQHGWAVGALGMIIATVDGGETWELQQGKQNRVAMLCVAPHFHSQPFEILAKYACEENRLCASLLLNGSRKQHRISVQATERLGSLTSTLIAPASGDPTRHALDTSPEFALEKIVRVIRSLRPNVIVNHARQVSSTPQFSPSTNPVALVEQAIQLAADPNAFSYQISDMGLRTWQVDRLVNRDPTGKIAINPQQLLLRFGILTEDLTALSRAAIGESTVSKHHLNYRVSNFTTSQRLKAGDLLSGLNSQSGVPSRKTDTAMHRNLMMIQEISAKHKRFEQFDSFEANNPRDLNVWNQQILSFALKLDSQVAGIWLMQLAERYLDSGKTELAANANNLLATRWPDHALAPAAMTWLVQYYASDEFGQIEYMNRVKYKQLARQSTSSKPTKTKSSFSLTPRAIEYNGVSRLIWLPTQSDPESVTDSPDVKLASATEPLVESRPEFFDQRIRLAGRYLSQLKQRDPDLVADPLYRLLEAQISRRITGSIINQAQFTNLTKLRDPSVAGIAVAAQRELQLSKKQPESKAIASMTCRFTPIRPTLDGKLDEPLWQSAQRHHPTIHSSGQPTDQTENDSTRDQQPDLAMFAYDDQFLYAGFTCQKLPSQYYQTRHQPRPRDADLNDRDRIELNLDIDRDYQSSFRFVVDHRGWVRESCGGSIGWNPDWYVSQSETESTWTVEFAIPLSQLIPGQIASDSTWALQIARRAGGQRDLWADPAQSQIVNPGGLRSTLEPRPRQFELIRFENTASITPPKPPTAKDPALNDPLVPIQ